MLVGWLGLLTCKNRLPYNLYCVGGDVKHCTIQSGTMELGIVTCPHALLGSYRHDHCCWIQPVSSTHYTVSWTL